MERRVPHSIKVLEVSFAVGQGDEIPDYETFDYSSVWKGRGIEDLAEKKLVSRWAKGENGIDLGGGFGRMTAVFERRVDRMFMLDYSRRNLRKASMGLERTTLIRTPLGRLPFEDNVFDFVALVRVMHHIPDPALLISEIVRVSRDGGTFALAIANEAIRRRPKHEVLLRVEPGGQRIYSTPLRSFGHPGLERMEIRGLGAFDNRIGRRVERLFPLADLDVATSRLWPAKPMLFVRYRVKKKNAGGKNEPRIRCACGGVLLERRCSKCGRSYGEIIDLAGR